MTYQGSVSLPYNFLSILQGSNEIRGGMLLRKEKRSSKYNKAKSKKNKHLIIPPENKKRVTE